VRGPLVVTITVLGFVKAQEALRRSGARPGDALCVSGTPGEAAAGLDLLRSGEAPFDALDRRVRRFLRAQPRLALGRCLRGHATAAMDVSDGLLGDLAKLTDASGVGATLELEHLPISESLAPYGHDRAERYVLTGGDDYELLFTLPAAKVQMLDELAHIAECSLHRIGTITEGRGITCTRQGAVERVKVAGYDHFAP
jgi:thiamine-monophosphate kinase